MSIVWTTWNSWQLSGESPDPMQQEKEVEAGWG